MVVAMVVAVVVVVVVVRFGLIAALQDCAVCERSCACDTRCTSGLCIVRMTYTEGRGGELCTHFRMVQCTSEGRL